MFREFSKLRNARGYAQSVNRLRMKQAKKRSPVKSSSLCLVNLLGSTVNARIAPIFPIPAAPGGSG